MSILNKLDSVQIFQLASTVIDAKKEIKALEIKSKLFIDALKLHEETSKIMLNEQTAQFSIVIEALKTSIESLENQEYKFQAIKYLAEYANLALITLGETSKSVLHSAPATPSLKS